MPIKYEKKDDKKNEEKPKKSVCEKNKTKKKGKKNPLFWIKEQQIDKSDQINMFTQV